MEAALLLLFRRKWFRRLVLAAVAVGVAAFLSLPTIVMGYLGNQSAAFMASAQCSPSTAQPVGRVVTQAKGLDSEALHNAGLIIAIGQSEHLDSRAWVVAISASLQESGLHNLGFGDVQNGVETTSRGLFQMIAETARRAGVSNMDPPADIRWFYGQLQNVANWQRLSVAMAAQSVEHSEFPDGSPYAKWQPLAEQLVRDAQPDGKASGTGVQAPTICPGGDNQIPADAVGKARVVIAAETKYLGLPYCWGGGGTAGPTKGIPTNISDGQPDSSPPGLSPNCSDQTPGFDCSGLQQYGWSKAGVALPRTTADMVNVGTPVTRVGDLQPGDLVFPDSGHVQLYLGHNKVLEAPEDGKRVRVWTFGGFWQARRVSS